MFLLRTYKPEDCKLLAQLFYDTVHCINRKNYTEEQVNAWATEKLDLESWNASFLEHYTLIAEKDQQIVGFGDITTNGYLDRLYVHKDYQRQGIATEICNELEKVVKSAKIITHASITAKVFFLKRGYYIVKEQQVKRQGIILKNFLMEKRIFKHPNL